MLQRWTSAQSIARAASSKHAKARFCASDTLGVEVRVASRRRPLASKLRKWTIAACSWRTARRFNARERARPFGGRRSSAAPPTPLADGSGNGNKAALPRFCGFGSSTSRWPLCAKRSAERRYDANAPAHCEMRRTRPHARPAKVQGTLVLCLFRGGSEAGGTCRFRCPASPATAPCSFFCAPIALGASPSPGARSTEPARAHAASRPARREALAPRSRPPGRVPAPVVRSSIGTDCFRSNRNLRTSRRRPPPSHAPASAARLTDTGHWAPAPLCRRTSPPASASTLRLQPLDRSGLRCGA